MASNFYKKKSETCLFGLVSLNYLVNKKGAKVDNFLFECGL